MLVKITITNAIKDFISAYITEAPDTQIALSAAIHAVTEIGGINATKDLAFTAQRFVSPVQVASVEPEPIQAVYEPGEEIETPIAGVSFEDRQKLIAEYVREGMVVLVVRQSGNEYDKNALPVLAGMHMIGYVPRDIAEQVAPAMDEQGIFYIPAVVTHINRNGSRVLGAVINFEMPC